MHKLLGNSISIIFLLLSLTANGVLSASTAKTIQGNLPALTFDNHQTFIITIDEFLSIQREDPFGNKTSYSPNNTSPIDVGIRDTPNQFSGVLTSGEFHDLSTLSPVSSYYVDIDGDGPNPTTPIEGYWYSSWTYFDLRSSGGLNLALPESKYNSAFEPCNSPYTFTTNTYEAKVNSAYGDPASNDYGTKSAAYSIKVKDYRLCYLQPTSVDVVISQTDPNLGGSNSQLFERYKGFSQSGLQQTGKAFPTIAFDQASFVMRMSNSQNDYTFNSNNPLASIDNSGVVTFNSITRPVLPFSVTLTATPKDTTFAPITYQFTVTEWARVIGTSAYANNVNLPVVTDFTALSICSEQTVDSTSHLVYINRDQYIFKGHEVTNSTAHGDFYYRDVDGTLQGEWGTLNKYSNAKWELGPLIWTSELSSDGQYQNVVGNTGKIGVAHLTYNKAVLACRT